VPGLVASYDIWPGDGVGLFYALEPTWGDLSYQRYLSKDNFADSSRSGLGRSTKAQPAPYFTLESCRDVFFLFYLPVDYVTCCDYIQDIEHLSSCSGGCTWQTSPRTLGLLLAVWNVSLAGREVKCARLKNSLSVGGRCRE